MKVFIGSSEQSIKIAEAIGKIIEELNHEPVLWNRNVFNLTDYTFGNIINIGNNVDAAIFIIAPDDTTEVKGVSKYTARDNVILEAGYLYAKLGIRNVVLCKISDTNIPTDWNGITYLKYEPDKQFRIKQALDEWLKRIAPPDNGYIGNLRIDNNLYLSSRDKIENSLTLNRRVERNGKVIRTKRQVRLINLACSSLLTPDFVDSDLREYASAFSEVFPELLSLGTSLEVIIIAPGTPAMEDGIRKIRNSHFYPHYTEGVFYSAYYYLQRMLTEDKIDGTVNEFKRAYNDTPQRFRYFVTDLSLPFAMMQVTHENEFSHLDHIKIDLYTVGTVENQRRCFIIWRVKDPVNYDFFDNYYNSTKHNYCWEKEKENAKREEWIKKWEELNKKMKLDKNIS